MSRDSWLNFCTAIVYGLVFILAISITTTVVLWANGSFRLYTEPADKIKFNVSEVIISENEGEANICVVSGQAVVDESGKVISDPAFREDVKLELWHINGVNKVEEAEKIVDITVERDEETDNTTDSEETEEEEENQENTQTNPNEPLVVEFGKNINIKALLASDSYNIGGTCLLRAYTLNELFKAEVKIYVDVPVQSISIDAGELELEELVDDSTATVNEANEEESETPVKQYSKFIQGDKFPLSLNVKPARALNAIKDIKTASFSVSESTDIVTIETLGDIKDNSIIVDIIARNNYKGVITLTAKLPKYYQSSYNEYDDSQFVFTTVKIEVVPLVLKDIIIQNNITDSIEVELFTNKVTRVSARDTGDDSITNLNLFLKPDFYNPNTNDDPLEYMINSRYLDLLYSTGNEAADDESMEDGALKPLTIDAQSIVEDGQYNIIWTITANRLILNNEHITLYVSNHPLEGETPITSNAGDNAKIVNCSVGYVSVKQNELVYDNQYQFNITKTLSPTFNSEEVTQSNNKYLLSSPGVEGLISVANAVNQGDYSFTKLAFFVTDGVDSNKNQVGSPIIKTTEYGQILHENINDSNLDLEQIQPMGQGSIKITPYLIMTDKDGNPVGYDFKILDDPLSVNGVVTLNNIISSEASVLENRYVIINEFNAITINVTENLDSEGIRIFNNVDEILNFEGNAEIDKNKIYNIARGNANKVTLYIIGNSYLAMTSAQNLSAKTSGMECKSIKYDSIDFGEGQFFNYAAIELYVPDESTATEVEFSLQSGEGGSPKDFSIMQFKVVDVGAKKVEIQQPGEEETTIAKINDNKLSLLPNVYTTSKNDIYNLQFTDESGNHNLPLTSLISQTVEDIAYKEGEGEEQKIYSLYPSGTNLTPLTDSGTIQLFITTGDVVVSDLMAEGIVAKNNLKNIEFYNKESSLLATFTPATNYAEISNNSVLMKQPIPTSSQLIAVYMIQNEYLAMQEPNATSRELTPMSMFTVTAQFPSTTPSVSAYLIPSTFEWSDLGAGYVTISNNGLTLLDDKLDATSTTFTPADEFVNVNNGVVSKVQDNTSGQAIYLLYLSTKVIEVGEQEKTEQTVYYISKYIEFTNDLLDTSLNIIKVDDDGSFKIPDSFTEVILSGCELKSQIDAQVINPALLNTTVSIDENDIFTLDKQNLNISLNSTLGSGYKLTTIEPAQKIELNVKVQFTVTFNIVISPEETDSAYEYLSSIQYQIQLPEDKYLERI